MLPRHFRLAKSSNIRDAIRRGKVYRTPYVRIYAYAAHTQVHSRVACIVGRRIHASAVVRHRFQRMLREAARAAIATLPHPYDMVWVAKPEIVRVRSLPELRESLRYTIEKLGKLKT